MKAVKKLGPLCRLHLCLAGKHRCHALPVCSCSHSYSHTAPHRTSRRQSAAFWTHFLLGWPEGTPGVKGITKEEELWRRGIDEWIWEDEPEENEERVL